MYLFCVAYMLNIFYLILSVQCLRPPHISHGYILNMQATYLVGSVVTYKCVDDLVAVGETMNICLMNGTWTLSETLQLPACCK